MLWLRLRLGVIALSKVLGARFTALAKRMFCFFVLLRTAACDACCYAMLYAMPVAMHCCMLLRVTACLAS